IASLSFASTRPGPISARRSQPVAMMSARLLIRGSFRSLLSVRQAFPQRFAEALGVRVVEWLPIHRRHEEYVLGALADGSDLRVLERDALLAEYLGDLGQQSGTVACDELDHRTPVRRVLRDGDLDGRREHPHLPRRAARDLERLLAAGGQRLEQSAADFLQPAPVRDRAAVALEHA